MLHILLGKDQILCGSIARLTDYKKSVAYQFYREIRTEDALQNHVRSKLNEAGGSPRGAVRFDEACCLYTVCRLIRPRIVVETGVAAGVSSAFILQALNDNSYGILHSIDLPNHEDFLAKSEPEYAWMGGTGAALVPPNEEPGFVIPNDLRTRWKLHLGFSQEVLPKVLPEVGKIDLFVHDSEHTYSNMEFEYQTAWPSIREGGFLLSHDFGWNSAFSDFVSKSNRRPVYLYLTGFGGLRK